MPKICETYAAQVHALLLERFSNCEPFGTIDVVKTAPWLEEERASPGNWIRMTSRVSAALCYFVKCGAVVLLENGCSNIYITDAQTLAAYTPVLRKVRAGITRQRSSRQKVTI